MDSRGFITVIFTIFYSLAITIITAYEGCDVETNNAKFHQCLDKWTLFREKQRSQTTWLTDDFLIKEICQGDVSVDDVDRCIKSQTDRACDFVTPYWKGTRQKYTFICKWRDEFLKHYQCRANSRFTKDVNKCIETAHQNTEAGGDYCWSTKSLRRCLHRALDDHCSIEAGEFFRIVFDLELEPSMKYSECKEDFSTLETVVSIDSPERMSNSDHGSSRSTRRKSHKNGLRRVEVEYQPEFYGVASSGERTFSRSAVEIIFLPMLLVLCVLRV